MKTPLNKWISVKDAMPGLSKLVVVYTSSGNMYFEYTMNKKHFYESKSDPVCFWMLLSKPTK